MNKLRDYILVLLASLFHYTSSANSSNDILFRKNSGQWNDSILFQTTNNYIAVRYLKTGISMAHSSSEYVKNSAEEKLFRKEVKTTCFVWNINFLGCNVKAKINATGEQNSNVNYLRGNNFSTHVIDAKDYNRITYFDLYEKIDLQYYRVETKLKYDFILKPGSNIDAIKLYCDGVKNVFLKKSGDLSIATAWGIVTEKRPYSYQIINGKKKEVKVVYTLIDEHTFGFEIIGDYNKSYDLIIDPITLDWATYMGGAGSNSGSLCDIVLDAQGNVYATGFYTATFPVTPGVYDMTHNGDRDIFVSKLSANGNSLLWSTYIGGNSYESSHGIKINANGDLFIVGRTCSNNFPVLNAFQPLYGGNEDVVIFKLINNGTALSYSTYFGGNKRDYVGGTNNGDLGGAIDINSNGEVFITGATLSSNFPVTSGVIGSSISAGMGVPYDGFVARFNAAGQPLYSTYLGGAAADDARAIFVNSAGEAVITGMTHSNNFPVSLTAFQSIVSGWGPFVFVTKINATATQVLASTYVGEGEGWALKCDAAGNTYVAGLTTSTNFPTTSTAYMPTYTGNGNIGVLFKLNSNFTALGFSTYLGDKNFASASMFSIGCDVEVNQNEEPFVAGYQLKQPFNSYPTSSCAYQTTSNTASLEIFITKFNPTASTIIYSTMLGGSVKNVTNTLSGDDSTGCHAVTLSTPKIELYNIPCNQELIVGSSESSGNFETTASAYQKLKNNYYGNSQPVVMKIIPRINPGFIAEPDSVCINKVIFTDTTTQCGLWELNSVNRWFWDFGDGNTSTQQHPVHIYSAPGTYQVKLKLACPEDSIILPVVINHFLNPLTIAVSPNDTICQGDTVFLGASGGATYLWNTGTTVQTIQLAPTASSVYSVSTTVAGCEYTDSVKIVVAPKVKAGIWVSDTVACSSLCTKLINTGSLGYQTIWYMGDGNVITNVDTFAHCFNTPGVYSPSLTVIGLYGCSASATFDSLITIYPGVAANFTTSVLGNTQNSSGVNELIQLHNLSTGATSWEWNFGTLSGIQSTDENPNYTYENSGTYTITLVAYNEYGCSDTAITIFSVVADYTFFIPNSFTVNNDGLNELFKPFGVGWDTENYEFIIFDRWGNKIFETNNSNAGWDGRANNGQDIAQIDVYIFKVSLKDLSGSNHTYSGHVTLLK